MSVDKDVLLKGRVPEDDVEIPGVGSVRVRGLSRAEVFGAEKLKEKGVAVFERRCLSLGMVSPALSDMEVQQWQEASPAGELDGVMQKIQELSGMSKAAEKEAVLDFRGDTDAGVRALPGAEAGDDGGGHAGADG